MRKHTSAGFLVGCCLSIALEAAAQSSDFFHLSLQQLAQIEVTTADRTASPLSKATSMVTVIRGEQLRLMGARTLMDVLRHVPGFQTGHSYGGRNYVAVRGIHTTASEKVLFMLNGHLLNDVRAGSAQFQFLDHLPLQNIERVEVVQGPVSALYGANALLAVINVITRAPEQIDATEVWASTEWERDGRVANRYNLLYGGELAGSWRGTLNLHYADIPGAELKVSPDAFGRSGEASNEEDYIDLQGSLHRGGLTLRGRYFEREGEDHWGGLHVLTESDLEVSYGFLDAQYQYRIDADQALTVRAYLDHQESDNFFYVLPPGVIPPSHPLYAWNATGYIANTYAEETNSGAELQYERGFSAHRLVAGLAYRHERLHDPRLRANHDPDPLPEVRDVSDYFNWLSEAQRDIVSVFVQDLWDVHDDLRVSVGARYDHYSDFGGSFNPRLGLNYQVSDTLNVRASYGTAFRAPDFFAANVTNNANVSSNPDLDPEETDTWDLEFGWQPLENLWLRWIVFYSELDDLIDTDPVTGRYENLGDARTHGSQLRLRYKFSDAVSLYVNHNYAEADFGGTPPAYLVPRHSASAMLSYQLNQSMHWHTDLYWQGETERTEGDRRDAMDGYYRVSTTLSTTLTPALQASISVFNLTDEDYEHPAGPDTLPNDYPAAGRSLVLSARYRF